MGVVVWGWDDWTKYNDTRAVRTGAIWILFAEARLHDPTLLVLELLSLAEGSGRLGGSSSSRWGTGVVSGVLGHDDGAVVRWCLRFRGGVG